jgi:hypothetical protein
MRIAVAGLTVLLKAEVGARPDHVGEAWQGELTMAMVVMAFQAVELLVASHQTEVQVRMTESIRTFTAPGVGIHQGKVGTEVLGMTLRTLQPTLLMQEVVIASLLVELAADFDVTAEAADRQPLI